MQDNNNTKGKHLTYTERLLIERWKNKDKNQIEKLLSYLVRLLKRLIMK